MSYADEALAGIQKKKEDGGMAYPSIACNTGFSHGMTLRDYFASQVIASIRGWHPADRHGKSPAIIAYEVADAMLEARK